MELVSTPQPHLIPGYAGHCPRYASGIGKTYGRLTHKVLVDPCSPHSKRLIVNDSKRISQAVERPNAQEISVLRAHDEKRDAVFRYPFLPGYNGFIPKMKLKAGLRFPVAATASVVEYEQQLQNLDCEARKLKRYGVITGKEGIFRRKLGDRLLNSTLIRMPLFQVQPHAAGVVRSKNFSLRDRANEIPYSKNTPPHFLNKEDPEKFILKGYAGHIPMNQCQYGKTNNKTTNAALSDFADLLRHVRGPTGDRLSCGVKHPMCSSVGEVYPRNDGMVPRYAGHVPGADARVGKTFTKSTIDAKGWLISENIARKNAI